jgi:hypothetical protein
VLAGAGMVYTHNIGWFCLTGLLLFYVVACYVQRERGSGISAFLSPLRDAAIAGLIIVLLFIPWLPTFLFQGKHVILKNGFWLARPTIAIFLRHMATLVWMPAFGPPGQQVWLISSYALGGLTVPAIWLAAIIGVIKWVRHGRDQRVTVLAACLAVAVLGVVGVSLFGPQSVFMEKVVIFMLAGLLLAASGIPPVLMQMPVGLKRRRAFRWCIILLLVTGASALVHHGMEFGEEWREATQFVVGRADPARDVIVIQDEFSLRTVAWYVYDTAYGPVDWSRPDDTVLVHREDPARNLPAAAGPPDQSAIQRLKQVMRPGRRAWAIYRTYDPSSFRQVGQFLESAADEPTPPRDYRVIRVREFRFR